MTTNLQAADRYVLVPVEPTFEMLIAARAADREYQDRMGLPDTVGVGAYDHWVAMIEAAPPSIDCATAPASEGAADDREACAQLAALSASNSEKTPFMAAQSSGGEASERESFEVWGNEKFNYGFHPETWNVCPQFASESQYEHEGTQMAWEGWQARAALATDASKGNAGIAEKFEEWYLELTDSDKKSMLEVFYKANLASPDAAKGEAKPFGYFRKNGNFYEKLKRDPNPETLRTGWFPLYLAAPEGNRNEVARPDGDARDAARYRWLRARKVEFSTGWYVNTFLGEAMDEAIDAALAAQNGETES